MTRMFCRLTLVARLVLLLNVTLSVSAAAATADEGTLVDHWDHDCTP